METCLQEWTKEQTDVRQLESLSLTVLFYSLLGSKEQQLEKERQEALRAQLCLDVSSFDRFADIFFDNLFTDWLVQERINQSLKNAKATHQQVQELSKIINARYNIGIPFFDDFDVGSVPFFDFGAYVRPCWLKI